jgi:hypothetical protein
MDTSRTARRPWRLWTGIVLVLAALALAQACGQSGSRTGPTTNTQLQLKLRRAGAAQIPKNCTGKYSVSGPGKNIQNEPLPADGQIIFQGQVGETYNITVTLDCGAQGTFAGGTSITLKPGDNEAEIVIAATKVDSVVCSPATVAPNQASTCVCNITSPTPANATWQGAAPTGPTTATFSNSTPGTYEVRCAFAGASASTNVTVTANTGTIVIENNDEEIELRATFSGGPQAVSQIGSLNPGGSASRTVQPGTYNVEIRFSFDGFLFCTNDTITVGADQIQNRGYDSSDCNEG